MLNIFLRLISGLVALLFLGSVSSVDPDPLYVSCPAGARDLETALPIEHRGSDPAFFAEEVIESEYQDPERMAELGFTHLVGMWNVVTALPCDRGREASVEFRQFRIIERDGESERVVQEISFADERFGNPEAFDYTLYYRNLWFTGGVPTREPIVAALEDGTYRLNARFLPKTILHGWTEPRVEAVAGKRYFVETEVRVTGDARLQLGMDFWRGAESQYNGWSEDCLLSNNCQAWLSDWLGDTGGEFVTWRVPSFTE